MRLPLLLALGLLAAPALAEEPDWLAEDPAGITGPGAVPVGEVQVTLGLGYDRARSGRARDSWAGALEVEAGIAPGLDLRFAQLGAHGRAGPRLPEEEAPDWGGATQLGLRLELAGQRGWLPALGVIALARTEYGRFRPVQEAEAGLLLASTLTEDRPVTLSLNLGWVARIDPEPGERSGRYAGAAAISQAVRPDTLIGLTWLREQQEHGERDADVILGSLRQRLSETLLLGAFAGGGVGRDSPRVVLGLSLKWIIGG